MTDSKSSGPSADKHTETYLGLPINRERQLEMVLRRRDDFSGPDCCDICNTVADKGSLQMVHFLSAEGFERARRAGDGETLKNISPSSLENALLVCNVCGPKWRSGALRLDEVGCVVDSATHTRAPAWFSQYIGLGAGFPNAALIRLSNAEKDKDKGPDTGQTQKLTQVDAPSPSETKSQTDAKHDGMSGSVVMVAHGHVTSRDVPVPAGFIPLPHHFIFQKRWNHVVSVLSKPIKDARALADAVVDVNRRNAKLAHHMLNLQVYLEADNFPLPNRKNFYDNTLPFIQKLALAIPEAFTDSNGVVGMLLPILKANVESTLALTRKQIACVLAGGFFSLHAEHKEHGAARRFTPINFHPLYRDIHDPQTKPEANIRRAKFLCIVHYFERLRQNPGLLADSEANIVRFHRHPSSPADYAPYCRFVGGDTFGSVAAGEEIRVLSFAECLAGVFFCELLGEQETLEISGALRFSRTTGHLSAFGFCAAPPHDQALTLSNIDASLFGGSWHERLATAAYALDVGFVKSLLETQPADEDANQDGDCSYLQKGRTLTMPPLVHAVYSDRAAMGHKSNEAAQMEIVKMLLNAHADVNIRAYPRVDVPPCIPQYFASHGGELDNVTPLHMARSANVAALLLDAKAHINARADGETPLCRHARLGHTDIVRLLLERGAETFIASEDCPFPVVYASFEIATVIRNAIRSRLLGVLQTLINRDPAGVVADCLVGDEWSESYFSYNQMVLKF